MTNGYIKGSIRVVQINEKAMEYQFKWYGYVEQRSEGALVRSGYITLLKNVGQGGEDLK